MILRKPGDSNSEDSAATSDGIEATSLSQTPAAIFRAYSKEYFLDGPLWTRILAILNTNGGAFGICGPRGSGKSWIMLHACQWARDRGGIGLWYPSPSECSSTPFLTALADNFASAIETKFLHYSKRMSFYSGLALISLIVTVLSASVLFSLQTYHITNWLPAAVVVGIFGFVCVRSFVVSRGGGYGQRAQLVRQATALRERIRYTAVLNSNAEINLGGFGGSVRWLFNRQRSLSERPATLNALVFDFRNLAELAGEVLGRPIVIAVDELDKLDDEEQCRNLLREIKSVFEIAGVHFLISISEEAKRELLGADTGVTERSVFNSSFYTVVDIPSLTPTEGARLVESRTGRDDPRLARVLCVLTAGNGRDLVRTWDSLIGVGAVHTNPELIVIRLLTSELELALVESVTQVDVSVSDDDRAFAAELLGEVGRLKHYLEASTAGSFAVEEDALTDVERPFGSSSREDGLSDMGSSVSYEAFAELIRSVTRGAALNPIWNREALAKVALRVLIGWAMINRVEIVGEDSSIEELQRLVTVARQDPARAYRELIADFSSYLVDWQI